MAITITIHGETAAEVRESLQGLLQDATRLESKIDRILRGYEVLRMMEVREMATLDEMLAEVTSESTKLDSLSALLDGIEQQLKDALAGSGISAEAQGKIDTIFSALQANTAKIDKAITTGTTGGGAGSTSPSAPPANS